MLTMGGYGLRFSLPITPDASREFDWVLISLSLIAVVYIGFVALVQTDMKKLIAYSSIAHMGFVTLGSFVAFDIYETTGSYAGAGMGIDGAMVQMISHGLISVRWSCVWRDVRPRALAQISATGSDQHHAEVRAFSCCSRWPTPVCRPLGFVARSSHLAAFRQLWYAALPP